MKLRVFLSIGVVFFILVLGFIFYDRNVVTCYLSTKGTKKICGDLIETSADYSGYLVKLKDAYIEDGMLIIKVILNKGGIFSFPKAIVLGKMDISKVNVVENMNIDFDYSKNDIKYSLYLVNNDFLSMLMQKKDNYLVLRVMDNPEMFSGEKTETIYMTQNFSKEDIDFNKEYHTQCVLKYPKKSNFKVYKDGCDFLYVNSIIIVG